MAGKRRWLAAVGLTAALLVGWSVGGPAQPTPAPRAETRCDRFRIENSTAFNRATRRIELPWRTDYPDSAPPRPRFGNFRSRTAWQAYLATILAEVRSAGFRIENGRVVAPADAQWWIAPWMDYGSNGREPLVGLTRERGPDPGDLSPQSDDGAVWAIGFYDVRGASAFRQIFADPCEPAIPATGLRYPEGTVSFKFLFTTARAPDFTYPDGAPEVLAQFSRNSADPRVNPTALRLLQVDIAVKDSRAPTGWVFGTYIWRGPARGDGLYDNLVPVGIMWGNDPRVNVEAFNDFATLRETHLNRDLDGVLWQRAGAGWPARPWPGLHGRLNGPADNLRSSCLSCHATAQWPASSIGMVSRASFDDLRTPLGRSAIVGTYMTNTRSGSLAVPSEGRPSSGRDAARSLDYSLQLQASLVRMCRACADGRMTGATPALCRLSGSSQVRTPNCPMAGPSPAARPRVAEPPARQ